ncbi:MAG: hypothetical protein ACRD22_00505, partial [Terriglobia bacterium]
MIRLFFRSLFVLCGFALASSIALAAGTTANLSWTAPTQYTDGTAIAAGELDHYTIAWSPAAGSAGPSGSLTVAGSVVNATVPVACGSTSFYINVTSTATAH